MSIDKRWILLLGIAIGGAAAALTARRSHHRSVGDRQQKTNIKSWENEGGNLAPPPLAAVPKTIGAKT